METILAQHLTGFNGSSDLDGFFPAQALHLAPDRPFR
jgi:hypothetical protein